MAPGSPDSGADYRLYNPYTSRFITEREVSNVLRMRSRRLPFENTVGCGYSEVDAGFVGSDADLSYLCAALYILLTLSSFLQNRFCRFVSACWRRRIGTITPL